MALFLAIFTALFALTSASWPNTEVETHTACTTQYGPIRNTTEPWLDYVPTNTYTTSAWSYFGKIELLTLKPSTTTLSATSTSTSYFYPADNWTTTVYTSTYYDTYQSTQTETVPFTTTSTVSQVETLIVPALNGFTALASASPSAAKKTNSWENSIPDGWEAHDVYWTTESPSGLPIVTTSLMEPIVDYFNYPGYISRRDKPSGQPTKIDCTETVQSNNFYTTSYITLSGPRATFTRSEIVATETSTFTVHTKPTAPPPTSVYTVEDTLYTGNTSYVTETVTTTQTATETVYPSTTSVLTACASANIVDSYDGHWLRDPPSWFPDGGNYTKQQIFSWDEGSVYSTETCCARAVVDPKTIFWRYTNDWSQGCEIWKGDAASCPAAAGVNGTSGSKVDVQVYYEPIADQGYWSSWDVGNGACGNVGLCLRGSKQDLFSSCCNTGLGEDITSGGAIADAVVAASWSTWVGCS